MAHAVRCGGAVRHFVTLVLAGLFFDLPDAASIAVIGAADGPTAIFVANTLGSKYLGAIMVAAYSYMALCAHRAAAGHPPVHDQKSG